MKPLFYYIWQVYLTGTQTEILVLKNNKNMKIISDLKKKKKNDSCPLWRTYIPVSVSAVKKDCMNTEKYAGRWLSKNSNNTSMAKTLSRSNDVLMCSQENRWTIFDKETQPKRVNSSGDINILENMQEI